MIRDRLIRSLLCLFGVIYYVTCAKILCIVPFPCKSHAILGSTLLKALARRGHQVTMVSSFPLEQSFPNYRDIQMDIAESKRVHAETIIRSSNFPLAKLLSAFECCTRINEAFLSDPNVRKLLQSGEQFDVVINMGQESLLSVGHALNASTIRFNMLGMHSMFAPQSVNPLPSAYVPNFLLPYSDQMNFPQRVLNTIMNTFAELYAYFIWFDRENSIIQKHFPGAPDLKELQQKADITFVNSHMATDNPRPHMPNVIQIGGFHLEEPEELPIGLKRLLDDANQGVVLFSMGSILNADILQDKLNETLNCFERLPYLILWKNNQRVDGQPANVHTVSWLPQKAVLAHPNVRLFITHGGLGSVLESVYHGVPMIILPIYLDQYKNAAQSVRNGYAIELNVAELTADKLHRAIREITTNPAYEREMAIRSDVFRQQEVSPMARAIYWIERVAKHKDQTASYLKCAALDMPLYQYFLLDVFGFIFGMLVLAIILLHRSLRFAFRFLSSHKLTRKLKTN